MEKQQNWICIKNNLVLVKVTGRYFLKAAKLNRKFNNFFYEIQAKSVRKARKCIIHPGRRSTAARTPRILASEKVSQVDVLIPSWVCVAPIRVTVHISSIYGRPNTLSLPQFNPQLNRPLETGTKAIKKSNLGRDIVSWTVFHRLFNRFSH